MLHLAYGKITEVTDQYCLVKMTDDDSSSLRSLVQDICKVLCMLCNSHTNCVYVAKLFIYVTEFVILVKILIYSIVPNFYRYENFRKFCYNRNIQKNFYKIFLGLNTK